MLQLVYNILVYYSSSLAGPPHVTFVGIKTSLGPFHTLVVDIISNHIYLLTSQCLECWCKGVFGLCSTCLLKKKKVNRNENSLKDIH